MKFKHFLALIGLCLIGGVFNSCSPSVNPPPPTTLNVIRTGGVMSLKDSNVYNYGLSCGCSFELQSENADSTSIRYDLGTSSVAHQNQIIKAFPRKGLTSGKHIGWLALTTLKPDTNPTLKDTLRDTVIVP